MNLGTADIAFVSDLFSDIPDLNCRKMFGGLGVYSGDTIFAIMRSDSQVLLKASAPFSNTLAKDGATQWTTQRKNGKTSAMPYWTLPDAALDDPAHACALARSALSALETSDAP